MSNRWEDLHAARQAADEALADAEVGLLEELSAAKKAFRKAKTPENEQRHAEAVGAVRAYRAVVREHRTGVGVVADTAQQDGEG